MAEIIYLKDVLLLKPEEKESLKKVVARPKLKSVRTGKLLKSALLERKKEDNKRI